MTELQNAAKAAATRPRIQPAEEGDDRPLSVSARLGRLQFHQSGKFRGAAAYRHPRRAESQQRHRQTHRSVAECHTAGHCYLHRQSDRRIRSRIRANHAQASLERFCRNYTRDRLIQVFRSVRTVRSCAGTYPRIRARHRRTARAPACRPRHSVGGDLRQS